MERFYQVLETFRITGKYNSQKYSRSESYIREICMYPTALVNKKC